MNVYKIKYGNSLLVPHKLANKVVIEAINETLAILQFNKEYSGQIILKIKGLHD
jgi:hypothetical protein